MVSASKCTQSMLPFEISRSDLPQNIERHKKEKSTSAKGDCIVNVMCKIVQVRSNLSPFYSVLFRSILFYSVLVYSASPCGQMNVLPMNSRASTPRNAEVGREARTQTEAIPSIALRTVKHCPPWASHQLAAS